LKELPRPIQPRQKENVTSHRQNAISEAITVPHGEERLGLAALK